MKIIYIVAALLCAATTSNAAPPNVVVIQADDVSKDMFSPWNRQATTPTIERLASEGVAFRNYVSPSICGPARFALVTSRSPKVTNCYHNDLDNPAYKQDVNQFLTLAKMFKDLGYATGFAGKWNTPGDRLHYDDVLQWEHRASALPHPVDLESPGKASRYWRPGVVTETGEQVRTGPGDFGPLMFNEFAVQFVREHRDAGPFFLHYAMVEPHAMGRGQYPSLGSRLPEGSNDSRFRSLCRFIDGMVGNVLKELPDNTIVVFCADNPTAGAGKQWASPAGLVGAPCLFWGAGVARRGMTRELFSAHDIMPTLATAVGSPPFFSDGRSHWNFVSGDSPFTAGRKISYVGGSQALVTQRLYFVRDAIRGNRDGILVRRRKELTSRRKKAAYAKQCQAFAGKLIKAGRGITRGDRAFVTHWKRAEKKEDAWYRPSRAD